MSIDKTLTYSISIDTTQAEKQLRRLKRQTRWLSLRPSWLLYYAVGVTGFGLGMSGTLVYSLVTR